MRNFDVLIIGSGLAAQTCALHLAPHLKVGLLTKRNLIDGASSWSQGGIAAVMDVGDSVEAHVQDTMAAGAGLCDEGVTRQIVSNGPAMIAWLIGQGVKFDPRSGATSCGLHLTREGGHSRAPDRACERRNRARRADHPYQKLRDRANITVLENYTAVDLVTGRHFGGEARHVHGAYALNMIPARVETFAAGHTVLATGGAGKVYLYTTNPDTASGDGIAMAWRAGCQVGNLEFVQFHPTCLYHAEAKSFLITEAVRGEGGLLKLPNGERFMPDHDPRAELAPRDIVARAIDFEMKRRGLDCVYLDISHKPAKFIVEHFPHHFQTLSGTGNRHHPRAHPRGSRSPLHLRRGGHRQHGAYRPEQPARHWRSRLHWPARRQPAGVQFPAGMPGHWARRSRDICSSQAAPAAQLPEWDESRVTDADEEIVISHNWAELRRFMWDYVGIVRTNKRLTRAAHRIKLLQDEIDEFYRNFRISHDLIELRNLVMTADLIVRSAQLRHESRGLHFSRDYPDTLPLAGNTIINPRLA